jgi:murein DD-endopeptidase MepM/ murein hydrolase activator NlpD
MLFSAGSVEDVITGQAYLDAATKDDVSALERLEALKVSLDELQEEFTAQKEQLDILEAELAAIAQNQLELVDQVAVAFNDLDAECRAARSEYERQLARERAIKAARAGGGAGGIGPEATPGFICPMPPPVSFINDWGFPRSGGRTHKGTDVFAAYGHSVVAVANGTINLRSGGLGGTGIWLHADYGVSFYYAHLSGYAPGITSGMQVSIGQEIGYNGDTGNARGGAPHVHFQIHPGGSSRPPVNPYPTLSRSC